MKMLVLILFCLGFSMHVAAANKILLPDTSQVEAEIFVAEKDQPEGMPKRVYFSQKYFDTFAVYFKVLENNMYLNYVLETSTTNVMGALGPQILRNFLIFLVQDEAELRQYCAPGMPTNYSLPEGVEVRKVACTAGREVFIVEPIFRRMNLHNQILVMFHEMLGGLRDENGSRNFFSNGWSQYWLWKIH